MSDSEDAATYLNGTSDAARSHDMGGSDTASTSSSILGSDTSTLMDVDSTKSSSVSPSLRPSHSGSNFMDNLTRAKHSGLEQIRRKPLVAEVMCSCELCNGENDIDFINLDPNVIVKKVASALEYLTRHNNEEMRSFENSDDLNVLAEQLHATLMASSFGMNCSAESLLNKHTIANSLVNNDQFSASRVAMTQSKSLLCFHAKNVPAINVEAYLLRILKYCPVSNDVFILLLVYFDHLVRRMYEARVILGSPISRSFGVDSLNVHRLIIAGITVASKFFSDVFYTNSRYAKVGGLPVHELNQLEAQFLLLNDFSLLVSREELQRYANHLMHSHFDVSHMTTTLPELPVRVGTDKRENPGDS